MFKGDNIIELYSLLIDRGLENKLDGKVEKVPMNEVPGS